MDVKVRNQLNSIIDVVIEETDFLSSNNMHEKFEKVTTILVEPPNSGTSIIDKLGYLLQEEGGYLSYIRVSID